MTQKEFYFLLFFYAVLMAGCTVNRDPVRTRIRQLQSGVIKDDTSYVYSLPFAQNESHRLVQGYFSRYSHKNRAALDFKMNSGTGIYAARAGVVTRVKEDGYKGGWNKKYRSEGIFIIIQHADSSRAGYWHLQHDGALVEVGDTVLQEQLIGRSGRTGYALFPHLHFLVWRYNKDGQWLPTATRFTTLEGSGYLHPYRKYHGPKL